MGREDEEEEEEEKEEEEEEEMAAANAVEAAAARSAGSCSSFMVGGARLRGGVGRKMGAGETEMAPKRRAPRTPFMGG
jgi:hypothetical protein